VVLWRGHDMSNPQDYYEPEVVDLSSESVCVLDHGVFVEVALRLAQPGGFGAVYYCDPSWEEAFSKFDHAAIGDGFEEIRRVPELWDVIDKCDTFVFPDVHHGGLQEYLESQGKSVWGARRADRMEIKKLFFRGLQETLGMNVPDYDIIHGLDALRAHCRAEKDRWIKFTPQYRGNRETFHHSDYRGTRQKLDELALEFGPMQDEIKFLSEKPIKGDFEGGFDTYMIDGNLPKVSVQGYERKDQCYLAAVMAYENLPKPLRDTIEPLLPHFAKHRARQMISTEVKIDDELNGTLLEPTVRFPSPAGEEQMVLYENFPQIIYHGARGRIVEPITRASFACEVMISHNDDAEHPREIKVPPEVREYWKLYNISCFGDRLGIAPGGDIIGAVVGIGDTPREAVMHLKHNAKALKDEPVSIAIESLGHLVKQIEKAQAAGIYFSDKEMPTMDDLYD